jgi:hypothetical protein
MVTWRALNPHGCQSVKAGHIVDLLTRNLLWSGVEDYTGLWNVVFEVQAVNGSQSIEDARGSARRIVHSLLVDGLIELFTCPWPPDNDAFEGVPPDDRSDILQDDMSWTVDKEGPLIWYVTTDKGFDLYKRATGWES